jgi:hypothetical protein
MLPCISDKCESSNVRGGNRASRVGSSSGSDSGQVGRVSLIFWKKSGRDRDGSCQINLHVTFFFFRFLIDFDWIKFHLISGLVGSGRVRVELNQFDFFKKLNQIKLKSKRIGRISQIRSNSATSKPTAVTTQKQPMDIQYSIYWGLFKDNNQARSNNATFFFYKIFFNPTLVGMYFLRC